MDFSYVICSLGTTRNTSQLMIVMNNKIWNGRDSAGQFFNFRKYQMLKEKLLPYG